MFLACLLRRMQFKQMSEPESEPKPKNEGSCKPAAPSPLRIRIPSGVQCSSCEDFKVLQVVNKTPSPWNCGTCLGPTVIDTVVDIQDM